MLLAQILPVSSLVAPCDPGAAPGTYATIYWDGTLGPDGKFVYVTTEDEGKFAQIDTATSKVTRQIKACNRPRTLVISRDSARAAKLDPIQALRHD